MDNNHSKGLTIKELKKNIHILDAFPPSMEVIEALRLFEHWCESKSEPEYESIISKLKDGTCNPATNSKN